MRLIRYKNPTEYSFYEWIKNYPDSEYWIERIKRYPNLKLCPLTETQEFYRFVKTACKNNASTWLKWDKIEKIISKEISILNKKDLRELEYIFEHLVNFYKTPAIKRSYSIENFNNVKKGYCIERGFKRGKFYQKEVPVDEPKGGIAVYDEKSKEYKRVI